MCYTPSMNYTLATGETITVDSDVAEKMRDRRWRTDKDGRTVYHVYRHPETGKATRLSLIALIFGETAPAGFVYRKKNGNPLDFRRENLELVARGHHSNGLTSRTDEEIRGLAIHRGAEKRPGKPTGVYARGNRYYSVIRIKGEQKYLGSFLTEEDAGRAYDSALEALGYAPVNFVD